LADDHRIVADITMPHLSGIVALAQWRDLYRVNPALRDRFAANAGPSSPSPPGEVAAGRTEIPQKTIAIVERGEIGYRPFEPGFP
jgi:hypothetical protein